MKKKHVLGLALVAMIVLTMGLSAPAFAGGDGVTNAPSGAVVSAAVDPKIQMYQSVIAILVPLALAVAKKYIPRIPVRILPLVAAGLGALLDVGAGYANLGAGNGLVGIVMGLAGVGVRELYDQAKKGLVPASGTVPMPSRSRDDY